MQEINIIDKGKTKVNGGEIYGFYERNHTRRLQKYIKIKY